MSTSELFNFSKNLRRIVGSELKKYGFKCKGTRFLREVDGKVDEIYFQRSLFNMSGLTNTFYLNLYVVSDNFDYPNSIRLNYPTKIKIPEYYLNTGAKTPQERVEIYERFSEEQKAEVMKWVHSLYWNYNDEQELIEILNVAKDVIITKGFIYFETVRNMINNISEIDDFRGKIFDLGRKLNNQG